MKRIALESIAQTLRQQRAVLFKGVADTEADLQGIAEDREAELEERAQQDRAARLFDRLDLRAKHEIELIDQALQRISEGRFGNCLACDEAIPEARLRALPATLYCVTCAEDLEKAPRIDETAEEAEEEEAASAELAPDLSQLSDVELRRVIVEAIQADGRVDTEELRILCRHGIVILDGAVPSAGEQQILRKLLMDVVGMRDLRDHLRVNEILWARDDRDKLIVPPEKASRLYEPPGTDDVVETLEEGTDYNAPDEPPVDEE